MRVPTGLFPASGGGWCWGLCCDAGGGSRLPASIETVNNRQHYLKMTGNEIFKFAVKAIPEYSLRVLEQASRMEEVINSSASGQFAYTTGCGQKDESAVVENGGHY